MGSHANEVDRRMRKLFVPVLVMTGAMFIVVPILIVRAPYESTMGLVQKIFYFHVPGGMLLLLSPFVCGIASIRFLMTQSRQADRLALAAAELTVLFGVITLMTGPLWARKAWGVWWEWDPRLTTSLLTWMMFVAYVLLRKYGGPGSEKLAAGLGIFGMANVPFVYKSVDVCRTLHPKTSVVPSLRPVMASVFWPSFVAFVFLYMVLLVTRIRLERQRDELERLYLELEG
jgi:heme exporter protein C